MHDFGAIKVLDAGPAPLTLVLSGGHTSTTTERGGWLPIKKRFSKEDG